MRMRDTEYLFHLASREHKYNGAYHKKSGSKSKRCTLPSDLLTNKQRKELSGPVMNYNIKKPMSWEEFKKLPADLQVQYALEINRTYRASCNRIAGMLGVSDATMYSWCRANDVELTRYRIPTPEWFDFIGKEKDATDIPGEITRTIAAVEEEDAAEEPKQEEPVRTAEPCVIRNMSMELTGCTEDILLMIRSSLRPGARYSFRFHCSEEGNDAAH